MRTENNTPVVIIEATLHALTPSPEDDVGINGAGLLRLLTPLSGSRPRTCIFAANQPYQAVFTSIYNTMLLTLPTEADSVMRLGRLNFALPWTTGI
jgi:hypothetical protein